MKLASVLAVPLLLEACTPDETIRAYGAGERVWQLSELSGAAFPATATLYFTDRHRIAGDAPCNSYTATMDIPYPWWGTGPIAATRRACPDLALETAFFTALSEATLSSTRDDQLVLSAEDGTPLLVFTPAE
ncbi:MAG: META domain-containing protein [Pseudomonadota bacterium]